MTARGARCDARHENSPKLARFGAQGHETNSAVNRVPLFCSSLPALFKQNRKIAGRRSEKIFMAAQTSRAYSGFRFLAGIVFALWDDPS
jgi:hypothetical protein